MRRSLDLALSAALSGLALVVAACAGTPPNTSLKVSGAVGDAAVTIDDQLIGTLKFVEKHGVSLPPGRHRVTVEKPGYFPYDKLVEAAGSPVSIEVVLEPIPD